MQADRPATLLRRHSNTGLFLTVIFMNSYFEERLWKAAFESFSFYVSLNVFLHEQKHNKLLRKWRSRSSQRRCSVTKRALRNFTKLTGKHLCQSLIFNKFLIILKNLTGKIHVLECFFKKASNTGVLCEIGKIFKSTFFTELLRWLVFKISNCNNLLKDFSEIPLTYSKSLITCNSHSNKLNLKMHSLTKNLFR